MKFARLEPTAMMPDELEPIETQRPLPEAVEKFLDQ
jgi:hypothetical protein